MKIVVEAKAGQRDFDLEVNVFAKDGDHFRANRAVVQAIDALVGQMTIAEVSAETITVKVSQ